jgi:hypothetical protein
MLTKRLVGIPAPDKIFMPTNIARIWLPRLFFACGGAETEHFHSPGYSTVIKRLSLAYTAVAQGYISFVFIPIGELDLPEKLIFRSFSFFDNIPYLCSRIENLFIKK